MALGKNIAKGAAFGLPFAFKGGRDLLLGTPEEHERVS